MNSWIVALSRRKGPGQANRSRSVAILVPADLLLLIFKVSPGPMTGYSRMSPPLPFSSKYISSMPFFSIYVLTPLFCVLLAQALHLVIPMAPKFPPAPFSIGAGTMRVSHQFTIYYTSCCRSIIWGVRVPSDILGKLRVLSRRVRVRGWSVGRGGSCQSRSAWCVPPRLIFTFTIPIQIIPLELGLLDTEESVGNVFAMAPVFSNC